MTVDIAKHWNGRMTKGQPTEEELVKRLAKAVAVVNGRHEGAYVNYTLEARTFLALMKALQDG